MKKIFFVLIILFTLSSCKSTWICTVDQMSSKGFYKIAGTKKFKPVNQQRCPKH